MRRLILIAFLVTACASSGSPAGTVRPEPTERPTPSPTPTPWPAGFAEPFCLAIGEFPSIVQGIQDMQASAEELDLDGVSLHAYSTGATALTIQVALEQTTFWKPASAVLYRWKQTNDALIDALDDIDKGAADGNSKLIDRGTRKIIDASKLMTKLTAAINAFSADTDFQC